MNITSSIFVFIIVSVFNSCVELQDDCVMLNSSIIKDWQSDSIGCLGIRRELINSNRLVPNQFVGKKINCVIKNLGKPNYENTDKNNFNIYYYISCGIAPPAFGTDSISYDKENKGATKMLIEYSAAGIVDRVLLIVP